MINAFFTVVLFRILDLGLSLLPDISWSVDSGAMSYFISLLRVVFYLLPMDIVVVIVSIIISFTTWRIIVSLIRTLWDLLPIA